MSLALPACSHSLENKVHDGFILEWMNVIHRTDMICQSSGRKDDFELNSPPPIAYHSSRLSSDAPLHSTDPDNSASHSAETGCPDVQWYY